MKSFAEELRDRREEKNLSLQEIAAATKINQKFLVNLEAGNFDFLPHVYIRAFLREYARCVGFDPEEALRQYDRERSEERKEPSTPSASSAAMDLSSEKEHDASVPHTQQFSSSPLSSFLAYLKTSFAHRRFPIFLGFSIMVAAGAIVFLVSNFSFHGKNSPVNETSFSEVIQENERTASLVENASAKNADGGNSVYSGMTTSKDSLVLQTNTTDTVWMSIVIDGKKTEEFIFIPKMRHIWKAKEKFVLTLGNAGGAHFTLNGKELGTFGKIGMVVRNIVVTKEGIKK